MKVKLETLSPVHVGSGEESLSRALDYYIAENGKVCLVDSEKLYQVLRAKGLEESFLNEVTSASSKFSPKLEDFLKRNRIDPSNVKSTELDTKGKVTGLISSHISSNRRFFIPGSTLKGAFRTALAWNYLKSRGQEKLEQAINALDNLDPKQAFKSLSLENFVFASPHYYDPLRNLQVSDTDFVPEREMQVWAFQRFDISRRRQDSRIPMPKQVIPPHKSLQLDMRCTGVLPEEGWFEFLDREGGISTLFQMTNAFSQEMISREERELSGLSLARYYTKLKKMVQACGERECILRVGFGKTFYDQTIASLIEKNPALNQKYHKYLKKRIWLRKKRDFPAPTTRVVYMEGKEPKEVLGWVKLTAL